jgi:iron complex transport system substrate-binding protein
MHPRIVSLLPSATELVCALGLRASLVGVSHECDFPPGVSALPQVTRTRIEHAAASAAIDTQVRQQLVAGQGLYAVETAALAALAPTLLVTQTLCEVCAVGEEDVTAAVRDLPVAPAVVTLRPATLGDMLADVDRLGAQAGVPEAATALRASLAARVAAVAERTARIPAAARPRVALLEWLDPLFDAGHWNPELITLAGGYPALGLAGGPSMTRRWEELAAAEPDVVVVACCGYDRDRGLRDAAAIARLPAWRTLRAVREGRVLVADGNAYFNRPGPRLVDSLELLAHALHPIVHPLPAGVLPALRLSA